MAGQAFFHAYLLHDCIYDDLRTFSYGSGVASGYFIRTADAATYAGYDVCIFKKIFTNTVLIVQGVVS